MNKNQIRNFLAIQGYTCSYSGVERIMWVHGGASQERIIHWGLITKGIILIED